MLNTIKSRLRILLKLCRSSYFCFRYLPFKQAVRIPIRLGSAVDIQGLKRGQIILDGLPKEKCYVVLIGGGKSPALQSFPKVTIRLGFGAQLIFKGGCVIGEGTTLRADKEAKLMFGADLYCNANNYFRAGEGDTISFGDDCAVGWDNIFNTTDGHYIGDDEQKTIKHGSILIGNHVWITTRCIIGKNTSIANDCVVAQGSVVTKSVESPNCIIAGMPAKVVKSDAKWEK